MAEYPSISPKDMAEFTGRPEASFPNTRLTGAVSQATLLFKIGTCLASLPDDPIKQELAKNAIIAFTDYILLSQPFAKALASPFSSESLGSYSYSKSAKQVASGDKTGIMWFDLAIEQMSVCDQMSGGDFGTGGIEVFEHDGEFVAGAIGSNVRLVTAAERAEWSSIHDPSIVISRN